MEMRRCNICDQTKPLEDFRRLTGLKNKFNKGCGECIAVKKERYDQNKDSVKAYQKAYREQNRDYFLAYRREWGRQNKETLQKWENEHYDNDPEFKRVKVSRQRLRGLIDKALEFEALVGCSFIEFKQHMEAHFKPGMSWANYGKGSDKWSIDHIHPLSKGGEAYDVKNLQPLWNEENSKKNNKIG